MKSIVELVERKPIWGWILFLGTMGVTFLLGLFASSIMERRVESRVLFELAKPIDDWQTNSNVWGANFPREYERWKQTADSSFKSKHGGSAVRDLLAEYPEMVVLWAGYPFSKDYKQARGHFHSVEDVRATLRTSDPKPGTCWTCKGTDVPRVMHEKGIDTFYKTPWASLGGEIVNPIGCLDCHNPKTMDLNVTRPALIEAYQRQGKDITKSTHQEMRSLVCAQCHVEYYFKDNYYLMFPQDNGTSVEQIEAYYDKLNFADWIHPLSKTPMLKAQHPDWEIYQTSVHYKRGLSCADCHMPYRSEGGVKFSDHKLQSPLNDIYNSCQVCHGENAEQLVKDVYERQDKIIELRRRVEKILAAAHIETAAAIVKGASEAELKPIQTLIRHSQWRWDFTVASVGGSFHSPLESARILGSAIDRGQEARVLLAALLAKHGVTEPIKMPDLSTKEKAQKYIGLDMANIHAEKEKQKQELFPKWDHAALEGKPENKN